MDFVSGEILAVDKPYGWTSFDVVKRLRGAICRRVGQRKFKVGHAGTLDPLATGVLIVCTGRATRRIDELQAGVKEYVARLRIGATTPSFDLEKSIDSVADYSHVTPEMVHDVIKRFIGTIDQVPPAFSAVKVDGKRAYNLARKGHEVELKPKVLVISEIEVLRIDLPVIELRIVCSKGTYIRALARDIGEALGCGAHLTALRRTRVGNIGIADCLDVMEAMKMVDTCSIEYPEWYEPQSHKPINPLPHKTENRNPATP